MPGRSTLATSCHRDHGGSGEPPGLEVGAGPGGVLELVGPDLRSDPEPWGERTLTSVTANTRADGEELLALASRLGVRPQVRTYGFEDASRALSDLEAGRFTGAAVIAVAGHGQG